MTAIFCLVVVVILCYLVANIRRSTTGPPDARDALERARRGRGRRQRVGHEDARVRRSRRSSPASAARCIAYRSGNVTADKFDYTAVARVLRLRVPRRDLRASAARSPAASSSPAASCSRFLETTLGVPTEFTLMLGGLGLILSAILNPEGIAGRLAPRRQAQLRGAVPQRSSHARRTDTALGRRAPRRTGVMDAAADHST